jgi:hypothetical protein
MCPRVGHAPPPPPEWPRSALLPQHHDRQENCERDRDRLGEHHQAAARKPVGGLLPGDTIALGTIVLSVPIASRKSLSWTIATPATTVSLSSQEELRRKQQDGS